MVAGEEEVVVAAEVRLLLRRHRSLEQARFLDCLADRHCIPLDQGAVVTVVAATAASQKCLHGGQGGQHLQLQLR